MIIQNCADVVNLKRVREDYNNTSEKGSRNDLGVVQESHRAKNGSNESEET